MTEKYELEIDALPVSLTKPPMVLGVPLVPFYGSVCLFFIVGMMMLAVLQANALVIIASLICLWLIFYFVMLYLCMNDPFGFAIAVKNFFYFRQHSTFKRWGNTDSYSP